MSRSLRPSRSVPLLLVLPVLALASCGGGGVTPFRLQHDAEQVQSLAADGALLAQGAQRGRLTDAFVRVHAGELAAEAADLREVLASAEPDPGRARATAAVVRLSGRVASRLDELGRHPGDHAVAGSVHTALDGVARAAERIAAAAA